jgi:hypothetical protein
MSPPAISVAVLEAAVAAAMLSDPERRPGAKVGVTVCGGNVIPELLTKFP